MRIDGAESTQNVPPKRARRNVGGMKYLDRDATTGRIARPRRRRKTIPGELPWQR